MSKLGVVKIVYMVQVLRCMFCNRGYMFCNRGYVLCNRGYVLCNRRYVLQLIEGMHVLCNRRTAGNRGYVL